MDSHLADSMVMETLLVELSWVGLCSKGSWLRTSGAAVLLLGRQLCSVGQGQNLKSRILNMMVILMEALSTQGSRNMPGVHDDCWGRTTRLIDR
jgi:hypothetical protein